MTREQRAGGSAKKPSGRRTKPGIAQDPVAFVREVLREDPYDKQEEILRAMAAARRVSVVGCNGSGKDWAAAPRGLVVDALPDTRQGHRDWPYLSTGG